MKLNQMLVLLLIYCATDPPYQHHLTKPQEKCRQSNS